MNLRLATWTILVVALCQGALADDADSVLPDRFDPLEADRPDFTESPTTVGRGRLQIESGWTYYHDRTNGIQSDAHSLPELLLRYGLNDSIELRLFWEGYLHGRERDMAGSWALSSDGCTDFDLGLRVEISEQSGLRPESALTVSVSTPAGSSEWTSSRSDPFIDYIYGWDIAERISLTGSTGAWWTAWDADDFTVIHQSFALGLGVTERLGCFCEWFGLFYEGSDDDRPDYYFDTGLTYLVTEDFQLDWRIGVGLSESADNLFTGVGFVVRN
ncbi:MAG: transporter [Pirellulales bacterium]|nr:transporter [Pirellulales bacterium]